VCVPKGNLIEEFPPDGSDQSFDEGMGQGHVWNSLDLCDVENPAHDILIDLYPKGERELLSDPPAAELRVSALHLDDGSDDFF